MDNQETVQDTINLLKDAKHKKRQLDNEIYMLEQRLRYHQQKCSHDYQVLPDIDFDGHRSWRWKKCQLCDHETR